MKGTRIRSSDSISDEKLRISLSHSEKDEAENSMIVDLIRNDLGKVSELGSVRVEKTHKLETYETVFQLTSILVAKLKKQLIPK